MSGNKESYGLSSINIKDNIMEQIRNATIKQHLIDPETCIQCNTCKSVCPEGAISNDTGKYVVDPDKCTSCMKCIPNCPTGAIENWRMVPHSMAYSLETQIAWDALPRELTAGELAAAGGPDTKEPEAVVSKPSKNVQGRPLSDLNIGSTLPPWSAAHPYTNLYGPENPVTATVTGNMRVTDMDWEYDTHLIVLDFGSIPFPVLEGQSIGVITPGVDATGKPHHIRQYSVSSARDGEREGYNNLSLTVKRVNKNREGNPVHGVASNYVCDLKVGDTLKVTGPYGKSFLMPNHPGSHIVMICTGTGSAPMRGMLHRRDRLRRSGKFTSGKLMLFFGARTKEELPFFGRLHKIPKDLVDVNIAFSRTPGQPKTYVQDLMRERSADLAVLLADPDTYYYICGLRSMEEGVIQTLREIAEQAGVNWNALSQELKNKGRLHIETY